MLEEFGVRLAASSSLDDISTEVHRLRDTLGVDHVLYHAVNVGGGQYAAVTYPDIWVRRYLGEDYARIDPVVQAAFRSIAPVDWAGVDWSGRGVRDFMAEAQEAGVGRHGLSLPIRGPGGQFALFSVNQQGTDRSWELLRRERTNSLILLAHQINEAVMRVTQADRSDEAEPRLSPRETDVLTLLAVGLSRAQAADHLEISEHTLRVYIESARAKLRALNTVHAVARALALGQIVL